MQRRAIVSLVACLLVGTGFFLGWLAGGFEKSPANTSTSQAPTDQILTNQAPDSIQNAAVNPSSQADQLLTNPAPIDAVLSAERDSANHERSEQQAQAKASATTTPLGHIIAQLEQEKAARQRLSEQVTRLEMTLVAVEQRLQQLDQQDSEDNSVEPDRQATNNLLDTTTLIAAGFSPDDAAYLNQRWGEQEMASLYLRDQAIREGWIDTPRYSDAVRDLRQGNSSLRDEIDDITYDQLLFAAGQPNRIAVASIIDSSPAQTVGLQSGDVILSYDGNRIYSGRDLRTATTSGDVDVPVAMQVERDGELIEFYIPRGPIGIRLDSVSVQP